MNYIWEPKPLPSEATIEKLRQELHLSQTTATLLAQRGITTYDEAMHFFSPSLSSLHDPFLMKDMHKDDFGDCYGFVRPILDQRVD